MSAWTQDDYVKSEFSLGGITLDDIVKDYYKQDSATEAAPLGYSLSSFTGERTADLTDLASYLNGLVSASPAPAAAHTEYSYIRAAESAAPATAQYAPAYEPEFPAAEPAYTEEPKSKVSAMEDEAKGIFAQLNADDYARLLAEEQAAAERDAQVEIDPRFNIGGKHRHSSMYYNGSEVDMSGDPNYTQPDQGFAIPSHYAGEGEPADQYFVEEKPRRFSLFKRKKRAAAPVLEEDEPHSGFAEEDLRFTKRYKSSEKDEPVFTEPEPAAYAQETYGDEQEPAAFVQETYDDEQAPYGYEEPSAFAQETADNEQEPYGEEPAAFAQETYDYEQEPDYGEEAASDHAAAIERETEEDREFAGSFRDYRDEDEYAENLDYEDGDDPDFPGSFREFIKGEIAGLFVRLRGGRPRGSSVTVSTSEDDEEDLGAEVNARTASKYYGSFIRSLRLRSRIAAVLIFAMIWLSVGLPVPGMLKDTRVASAMLLACQLNIMLLALDVLTGAIMNISRLKFGADALVLLSSLITSADAILVARTSIVTRHIPLCVLSSVSLLGLMIASLLSARSMRKAIRVPAIAKRIYTVTGETDVKDGDVTLLKSVRSYKGFVRRCEEAPPDETLFIKLSPFVLLVSVFFALIVAVAKHHTSDFLYIFSAVLAPAVPFSALLCFALPYFIGSDRIFDSGAAIAGWSGLCDIGNSRNLIVTDRDLFPEGSVELDTIRIFADESSEKVISYAGTMLTAAGSSVSSCFADVMERNGCTMRQVENFEYLSGGGMKGVIDGDLVLCGSTDLMRLMNVRIPYRLVDKCSVLLAINGVLYGIFNMKYTGQPQVRYALTSLMRSSRHPIFAIRDFNVTPDMIHNTFDVATDGYDFPPYVERFAISDAAPSEESQVAAVVCREGLAPLTHMADTGRSMYMAVRINLMVTAVSVVLTLLTVFLKLIISGTVGAGFLLAIMAFWAIPVIAVSVFMHS